MTCAESCSNPAEYRIHRTGFPAKNVCDPHRYVAIHSLKTNDFVIQPLTLEGHVKAFKASLGFQHFVHTPSTVAQVAMT